MHSSKISAAELKIGAKIGALIQDEHDRARLANNSGEVLAEIGLQSTATIYADTADKVHLVVPASVDEARVAAGDQAYFEELGQLALGICMYEDLPE